MTLNKLNALRWYDTLAEQNHRKWYVRGRVYPLITPVSKLLPFQFHREATNEPLTSFKIYSFETDTETELLTEMQDAGLTVFNHGFENYEFAGSSIQDPSIDNTRSWGFSIGQYAALRYIQVYVEKIAQVPPISFADWYVRFVLFDGKGGTEIGSYDFDPQDPALGQRKLTADFGEIITTNGTDVLWLEIRSNHPFYLYGRDGVILTYTPEQESYGLSSSLDDPPNVNIGSAGDYDAYARIWGGLYNHDLIIYPGLLSYDFETPVGRYYCIMSDANNTWYSEVFSIVSDVTRYLKISYWHRYGFVYEGNPTDGIGGHIRYLDELGNLFYKSVIYLDAHIGKPAYIKEDEISSRSGSDMKIRQVSWKELRFEFFAPEYLLDAMRIIDMHHDIEILYQGETYTIRRFLINESWQEEGHIAVVECVLRLDTVVAQNGDNVVPIPDSLQLGYWTAPDGDFWVTPDDEGWLAG